MSRGYRQNWDPCQEFGNNNSKLKLDANLKFNKNEIAQSRVTTIAKAYRKELPEVKVTWKSFLPTLSNEDVRRYRIPRYEVVILELEEAGYNDAAQCMKMLFALDEELKIKAGPGTIIWNNPRLKDRVDFLDRLKIGLAEANRAMLGEQKITQASALLEIALYFQKTSWEWWWIAEQLFRSALNVSETIEDDYQTVTTIRYLYGRFLFNEMKDAKESLKFLDEARDASQGKLWNASKILGAKQDSVFRECCTMLYRALLSLAKNAQENEADFAVEACKNALKHAMDSGHDEYITDATCELGRSYLRANQAKLALQNFVKYLNMSRKIPDYEGICNAHMELAFAYKELGDPTNTIEHLELFREAASRFKLPYKLAQAHYLIGEHLLSLNKLDQATSNLEFSFTLYNDMGQIAEANKARCVAAVSKGQGFIDQFIEQILRCGNHDQEAALKLCDWKNNREPFWITKNEEHENCGENSHCSDSSRRIDDLAQLQRANDDSTETESNYHSDYETSSLEIVTVKNTGESITFETNKTKEDDE